MTSNLNENRGVLGICWIIYGILRLVAAVWLMGFAGTATVMFGAVLVRVPNPYSLMNAFHFIYAAGIVLSAACGIFGILAGIALFTGWSVTRLLALIAGFLALSELPLGITLGTYTLIVFLPAKSNDSR